MTKSFCVVLSECITGLLWNWYRGTPGSPLKRGFDGYSLLCVVADGLLPECIELPPLHVFHVSVPYQCLFCLCSAHSDVCGGLRSGVVWPCRDAGRGL